MIGMSEESDGRASTEMHNKRITQATNKLTFIKLLIYFAIHLARGQVKFHTKAFLFNESLKNLFCMWGEFIILQKTQKS